MGGYVNLKTFDHTTSAGEVKGKEISVAFELYSDVHRVANSHYQVFPSEKAAYSTVFEKNQRDAWITANENLFKPEPASGD
ncbi:small outer capsid protein [Klebsiella phage vB_KpnM_VPA32]|nr:small outer capsid protein [Klebsiella phage vB_KpnM_VPA32]